MLNVRVLGLAAVLLAGGCASIAVQTQFDSTAPFETYHRYYFYWYTPHDGSVSEVPSFQERAHEITSQVLAGKGYLESGGKQAEFLVRLRVFEEDVQLSEGAEDEELLLEPSDRPETERPAERAPLPEIDERLSQVDPFGAGIESLDVDDLTVGDVLVEVFDVQSGHVVWWALGKGIVAPRAPDGELRKALEHVLERFPPERTPAG